MKTHSRHIEEIPEDLQVLAGLVSASSEGMSPDARRRVRQRVIAAARSDAATSFQRTVFIRAAAVFTAGATLLGGVSFASAAALPGDALYGVKRGAESVAIAILPEGTLEREFLFEVADRRAEEIRRLIAGNADPVLVQRALGDFGAAVRVANQATGEPGDVSAMTRSQERLVERIRAMAGSAREQLELEMQKALGQQPAGGGTHNGATGTGAGTPSTSGRPSSSAPGGSGSSDGSAPSDGSGSGSGSGGSSHGGSGMPDAGGSSETTGGPSGHRGP